MSDSKSAFKIRLKTSYPNVEINVIISKELSFIYLTQGRIRTMILNVMLTLRGGGRGGTYTSRELDYKNFPFNQGFYHETDFLNKMEFTIHCNINHHTHNTWQGKTKQQTKKQKCLHNPQSHPQMLPPSARCVLLGTELTQLSGPHSLS